MTSHYTLLTHKFKNNKKQINGIYPFKSNLILLLTIQDPLT